MAGLLERAKRSPLLMRAWSSRPLAPIQRLRRRLAARRTEALLNSPSIVAAELAGGVPSRELWIGPADPFSHFLRWPFEYRVYLALLCGLRPEGSVLELGCGHGRTMLGLIGYLEGDARYEGLDIDRARIEFAQQRIGARYPQFRFTHANVRNLLYNPEGTLSPRDFSFPYGDAEFDVVYAASLFTHLLAEEAANYLRETARVMRPGAAALLSFFVLDFYRGPGTTISDSYTLDHQLGDGVAVRDPKLKEGLVAYSRARIERIGRDAGLRVSRQIPGYWSRPDGPSVNEQDLVLFERA
jgi:ubiquinone/menaquinone biosynthesis C-methylase UbiE